MFDIENNEKEIVAVGYENKTVETEDQWIKFNLIGVQYLIGTNHYLPLSHMAKSYIGLKKTINVFMSTLLGI